MRGRETRLKHVARLAAGGTPDVSDSSQWAEDENGTPWIAIADMSTRSDVSVTERRVTDLGIRAKNLSLSTPETVLFAMYASVGAVARPRVRATWNQAIVGLEPRPGRADSAFLAYWLEALRPGLGAEFRSNTQNNLNADQVANFPFPGLTIESQREVADFLDAETARIDALIAKKRGLELAVQERMASRIEAEVCSASFPWRRLRYASGGLTVGIVVNPSTYVDETGDVPYVRGTDVERFRIRFDRAQRMSRQTSAAQSKSEARPGDILTVRVGAPGVSAVVPPDIPVLNCASVMITRATPAMDSRFLCYGLNSQSGQGQFSALSNGAAQEQINISAAADLLVPAPDLSVQRAIADRLDRERAEYLAIEQKLDRQIELLREHRQALITAAVTGVLVIP
jgi:type I restriction enzyme, S subunit